MNKMPYLLLLLASAPAFAAGPGAKQLKEAFCPFQEKKAKAVFAPQIFHDASMEDFAAIFAQQAGYYGPCKSVVQQGSEYLLTYRDATLPLRGQFADGKIRNFYFGRPDFPNDSFEKIAAFAKKALGTASIFVSKEGAKVYGYNPQALNIGPNNQLFILKALKEKTARKEIGPETILKLDDKAKSGSQGFLQFWVEGTALTVDTLKNMMVVERDLTAADMLAKAIGRNEIEKGGKTLAPFLTNREYAQIYADPDGAGIQGSPQRLADLAKKTKYVEYPEERYDLTAKAGWFATNEEVCAALSALKEEKLLFSQFRIATEEEGRERWSDYTLLPARGWGIAQNSALLRIKGRPEWYCVSVTANAQEPLEEQAIGDVTHRIYSLIYKQ